MSGRYLTFDCYGTLVDWKTGIEKSLRKAMGEIPLGGKALLDAYVAAEKEEERSYKKYRQVLSSAALRMAESFGLSATPAAAAEFADSVPAWPVFPDTRDALHEFGRRGYLRYILSNVDTDLLLRTIEGNGLEIDGFVTAEEVGSYKPRPGHWTRLLEKTGAKKGEILHVAQSVYHDIIPAESMGIASAWVNRYGEPLPAEAEPAYITDSLASLNAILS
jgi:2-haloalkanoic acid dehalogenase type II